MPKYRRGLFKIKNSPNFYRYVKINGRWWMKTTGTSNYSKACEMLDQEREGPETQAPREVPTLEGYADVYLNSLIANQRRPKTLISARDSLRKLLWKNPSADEKNRVAMFAHRKLDSFTITDIEAYKVHRQGQGVRPATINKELTLLRGLLGRAKEAGAIQNVPCRIKRLRVEKRVGKATFKPEEVRRILNAALDPRELVFVLLAFSCGLRRQEICWLTWEDVEGTRDGGGIVTVRGKADGEETWTPKSHAERQVPFESAVMTALKEYRLGLPHRSRWVIPSRDGTRLSNPSKIIQAVFKRAGCYEPGKLLHAMRHTFGTQLGRLGGDIVNTQALMGHADLRTTQGYMHADEEHKRVAIKRAGFDKIIRGCAKISAEVVPIESRRRVAASESSRNHSGKSDAPVAQLDRASDFEHSDPDSDKS